MYWNNQERISVPRRFSLTDDDFQLSFDSTGADTIRKRGIFPSKSPEISGRPASAVLATDSQFGKYSDRVRGFGELERYLVCGQPQLTSWSPGFSRSVRPKAVLQTVRARLTNHHRVYYSRFGKVTRHGDEPSGAIAVSRPRFVVNLGKRNTSALGDGVVDGTC
jgi:hypothetical protein